MGSIMDIQTLRNKLNDPETFSVSVNGYVEYVVKIDYNETIPKVYNRIRKKLDDCMSHILKNNEKKYKFQIPSCPDGYVEKSEIRWFTLKDLKKEIKSIRNVFVPTIGKVINIMLDKKIISIH